MTKRAFTHTGYVLGCDARVSREYRRKVRLRETKTLWVGEDGYRFSKRGGCVPGDWPMWRLDLESIAPIEDLGAECRE